MRYGICTDINNAVLLEKIGYDYFETSISALCELSQDELREYKEKLSTSKVKLEACNCLFPWQIKLIGPDVNQNEITDYLHRAFSTAQFLGVRTIVFGSGGSRRIPEGISYEDGYEQLLEQAKNIARIAAKYDVTVALEPLNRNETNIINSVLEGHEFVAKVNHPSFKLLADSYHMFEEDEPSNTLTKIENLAHVHIATKGDRKYPTEDEKLITEFLQQLSNIGYNEKISIEGNTDNFEADAIKALRILKGGVC